MVAQAALTHSYHHKFRVIYSSTSQSYRKLSVCLSEVSLPDPTAVLAESDIDSVSDAGAGGFKICKFLGIKSSDKDPLCVAPTTPWTRYDAAGEPSGRQSDLSRKVIRKYYRGKSESDVFIDIEGNPNKKAIFLQLAERYVEQKKEVDSFICASSFQVKMIRNDGLVNSKEVGGLSPTGKSA